jgi:hypothetical protein
VPVTDGAEGREKVNRLRPRPEMASPEASDGALDSPVICGVSGGITRRRRRLIDGEGDGGDSESRKRG